MRENPLTVAITVSIMESLASTRDQLIYRITQDRSYPCGDCKFVNNICQLQDGLKSKSVYCCGDSEDW